MKVVYSDDDSVKFDNGLEIIGEGVEDCCAQNYMDFEQFTVGREFPDMTLDELESNLNILDDGVSLKDSNKVPAWGQARSIQNGYYSSTTYVYISDGKDKRELGSVYGTEED